jgi:prevent-host-death family protein
MDDLAMFMAGGRKTGMRFASVAETKDRLSEYLARACRNKEPIVVTRYGKPYAIIQALSDHELRDPEWKRLCERRLERAWEGEEDALYDYL